MVRDHNLEYLGLDASSREWAESVSTPPNLAFPSTFPRVPLALSDPSKPVPRTVLDAPGGFLWWYVDLRHASGDGAVLIWSFGLPFLPAYRRTRGATPAGHPALNVVVYRSGTPVFYHLQRFGRADAEMSADQTHFRFGASEIRLVRRAAGGVGVHADLQIRESGSEAEARVVFSVQGKAAVWHGGDAARDDGLGSAACAVSELSTSGQAHEVRASSVHAWTPLLASGSGVCTLETPTLNLRIPGEAYLDRNHSTKGLHALGIKRWDWGRVSASGTTYAYYVFESDAQKGAKASHVFRFTADGNVVHLPGWQATLTSARPSRYGVRIPRGVVLREGGAARLKLRRDAVVDQSPFYVRSFLKDDSDKGWLGTSEVILPGRIDIPWQTPLIKMRVQPHSGERPSTFLPLFQGSRPDRLRRLARGALNEVTRSFGPW